MSLARLRRKYTSLGYGELASTVVFVFVSQRFATQDGNVALWSALVPLLLILVQGGSYWLLARRWVGKSSMPEHYASAFRAFQALDLVALAVGLAGVVIYFPSHAGTGWLIVGIWLFGLIEYINYFVLRLSYPIWSWLPSVRKRRLPQLVQDMRSATSRTGPLL